jgi:hypothetical protein
MKSNFRLLLFLVAVIFSGSTLSAQQIKQTGTEQTIPAKTVIIMEPGSEQPGMFLSGIDILRFAVYKAGSASDVSRIMNSLKKTEGIKKVTEGPVSGDMKEFVIELNSPRDLSWYKSTFLDAGMKNIKFSSAPVRALKDL